MPSAEREDIINQGLYMATRPRIPASGGEAFVRRKIRMQEDWDKRNQMMIDQQEAAKKEEVAAKEMEMRTRDQSLQENEFYYNRGLKEAEQKLKAQQLSEATAIINGLNQLDPRDPEYQKKRSAIFGNNPFGAADPNVQKVATEYSAVNDFYSNAMKEQASGIKAAQDKYAQDMQSLMEAGVPEEELPQYINPKSPVGLPMFDPLKVAAKLGTTKAEREAETRATKEETPKEAVKMRLRQHPRWQGFVLDTKPPQGRMLLKSPSNPNQKKNMIAFLLVGPILVKMVKQELNSNPQWPKTGELTIL
jgi:hypothetical protein